MSDQKTSGLSETPVTTEEGAHFFMKVVKHNQEFKLYAMDDNHIEGVIVGKAKIYFEQKKVKKQEKHPDLDTSRIVVGL